MTDEEIFEGVLKTLLRDTNLSFWKELQNHFQWLYSEAYHSIANDPHVLADQRSAKLLDVRYFLAEKTLTRVASENRLLTSGQKIKINNWNYTLIRGGAVCMVQNYVQTPYELARPSKFREAHAAINSFLSAPQLALGDVEPAIFDIAKINGIIAHGPVGKKFEEDDQRLAFLNFTVPDESYSIVGLSMSAAEIISRFEHAEVGTDVPQRDIATPRIKRPATKKQENS